MEVRVITIKEKLLSKYSFFAELILIIVVSFYYQNKFFNISKAKSSIFINLSVLLLSVAFIFLAFTVKYHKIRYKIEPIDIGMAGIAVTAVVSAYFSSSSSAAFTGELGWGIGAISIVCLIAFYFVFSNNIRYNQNFWLIFGIALIIISIIGITDAGSFDLLRLHEGIFSDYYYLYFSTLGNANWIVGYLSLCVPLYYVFFLNSDKKFSVIFNGAVLLLTLILTVLLNCNGMFISIGVFMFFAAPYIFGQYSFIKRTSLILSLLFVSLTTLKFIPVYGDYFSKVDGIVYYLTNTKALIIVSGCFILLTVYLYLKEINYTRKASLTATVICEVMLAIVSGYFIFNTVFNFDEDFGTGRGFIWGESFKQFFGFSLKDMLIGIGPDTLDNIYTEIAESFGTRCLAAHSEPLQVLLTMGIFGLAFWLLPVIDVIRDYFKNKLWKSERIAFSAALIAYLAQSLVNSASQTNLVLLIIVLAFYKHLKNE